MSASHPNFRARLASDRPLSIAILAMGGQGGGVLSDWIVSLAEANGWAAQSSSVPGVAQRTGATIYYIEMLPRLDGKRPIFSLMPTPGDVDIVLAAEFMEAGRAMLRGLVNPNQTTLIASSHRSYAVVEKQIPGDGIGDPAVVEQAAEVTAKRIISFDMQQLAEQHGSVISATMFGALAAAEVLPFSRQSFETTIKEAGKGVDGSLRGFSAAFDRTAQPSPSLVHEPVKKVLPPVPSMVANPKLERLLQRIRDDFPAPIQPILFAGAKRLIDYQDLAYAHEYLDRMEPLVRADLQNGGAERGLAFALETAKYLAIAMAYDDVIRVADLKTRRSRFERVRKEVSVGNDQIIYTIEFMHPRLEEVLGTLPATLGRFIEGRPHLCAAIDRVVNRPRRVPTGTIFWFSSLYFLGSARFMRRKSLRHIREFDHIEEWLGIATKYLQAHYDLAREVICCRRLVKGYSDTHARGTAKFERVIAMAPRLAKLPDGAAWLRRLQQAALLDENGTALEGAIKTIESFEPT
jgi:indolepyruvate ferredoxin oxidoreductase, beta subunit